MSNLFMGIDVSKGYADFIIIDHNKNIIEEVFQLDDTFDGHQQLVNILKRILSAHTDATIYAAVESTGGLENNWLNMLLRLSDTMNIKAARINPIGPYALHKASMERNGSDAISARKIAEYLIAYPQKVTYNFQDPYTALRKQYNLVEMFKKQKTQLLNQLNILLYTNMPFLVHFCKDGIPRWLLILLSKYPSAAKISKARETSIARIPYISSKRAKNLIEQAKQNIGTQTEDTMAFIIETTAQQIIHLTSLIEQHKKYMVKHCNLPEIKIIESLPGIGRYSAIGLLLNIVSIERFPTAKHLASYFGLHPVYKQSGDGSGGFKMSKKGRAVPRQILFMVARTAIIHNPLIKEVYIDHLKRGKSKMAAIGVCMHKILRIIFGMLKNNKTFDPDIDKRNRNNNRKLKKDGQHIKNKKRRFLKQSLDAPISRRQALKRKGNLSQTEKTVFAGSTFPLP